MNRLNGWQRLWLLATALLQVWWMVSSWSARWPLTPFAYDDDWTTTYRLFVIFKGYLLELPQTVIYSAILYAILHILVVLIRWALKGFKK